MRREASFPHAAAAFAAWVLLAAAVTGGAAEQPAPPAGTAATVPRPAIAAALAPALDGVPGIFVYRDTCAAYLLRDGDAALLVNLGTGDVLDAARAAGVARVEWVLFTDHHREHCQGAGRLDRAVTRVAAPAGERELFESPRSFRKWRPALGDKYCVHGASYVRPPAEPIPIDRPLAPGEVFRWRGFEITCLETPGTSPGGTSYLVRHGGRTIAFNGSLIHDGSRLANWFDVEWDYGFGKGLDALVASVERLAAARPDHLLPAQGPPIPDAAAQLARYHERLVAFRPDYLRGYPVDSLTKRPAAHPIVAPTPIPQIVRVTPHLYKFSDALAGKNFAIIISDRGRGLLLDCGLFPEALLDELIAGMQKHLGLERIDALWINHMHGDHFTLGAALRKRHGAKIWTLDRIADKVTNPLRYDYCALITSYDPKYEGLPVDRPLRDGEIVRWEGLDLHVDWMPGQTEFGNCLWLELDGRRIAFTGDNIFGDPSDPAQNGHEAVVARNSAIFEEGYVHGSRYLRDLKPDIVMGAHNVLMTEPAAFLDRYHEWSRRIVARYRELLPDPDYEYGFDPFWVSAYPYRVDLAARPAAEATITVRNFRSRPQRHRIRIVCPPGVTAEPAVLEGEIAAESRQGYPVRLTADTSAAAAGVLIVPFDIELDGVRHGQLFDFLVQVRPPEPPPAAGGGR